MNPTFSVYQEPVMVDVTDTEQAVCAKKEAGLQRLLHGLESSGTSPNHGSLAFTGPNLVAQVSIAGSRTASVGYWIWTRNVATRP